MFYEAFYRIEATMYRNIIYIILIKKNYAYGIKGNVLELCASYLKNRSQFVVYDRIKSCTKNIDCGVLQGSILGSLFFIVFMNEIFHASQSLFNILYADDTSIFAFVGKKHKINPWLTAGILISINSKISYIKR